VTYIKIDVRLKKFKVSTKSCLTSDVVNINKLNFV